MGRLISGRPDFDVGNVDDFFDVFDGLSTLAVDDVAGKVVVLFCDVFSVMSLLVLSDENI